MTDTEIHVWRADFLREQANRLDDRAKRIREQAQSYRDLANEIMRKAFSLPPTERDHG